MIVSVVAGIVVMFILTKEETRKPATDLASGKIYMQERQQKRKDIPQVPPPSNPESFTFYKILNSKKDDIVPLNIDNSKIEKKEEHDIKDPQQEKMQQIEKEMERDIEKRGKKDDVYTVQVAALTNESTANEVISRLKLYGYESYLIKVEEQKGRSLYKVRVGTFVSIVDAQDVAKLLKRVGFDTYVVKAD